jgi:hypothetical protein
MLSQGVAKVRLSPVPEHDVRLVMARPAGGASGAVLSMVPTAKPSAGDPAGRFASTPLCPLVASAMDQAGPS